MLKPVNIDPEWVRPTDPQSEDRICISCLTKSARWIVGTPENSDSWCAHCVLYKTEWGKSNGPRISDLVAAVEENMGRKISANGEVNVAEAHRILGAIVASARLRKVSKRR